VRLWFVRHSEAQDPLGRFGGECGGLSGCVATIRKGALSTDSVAVSMGKPQLVPWLFSDRAK